MRVTERECCIAIPDAKMKKEVIAALSLRGFHTVGEGDDCFRFLRTLRQVQPHLAVLALDLPGNVNETATMIDRESISAILLVTGHSTGPDIVLTKSDLTVLYLPEAMPALATVAEVLCREYSRRRKIYAEKQLMERKMKDRGVIEQAKGFLMRDGSLDEPDAHRILQRRSMESRLSMKEVAEVIVRQSGISANA